MITNPNTSGIFETDFKKIADKVHEAGGLVYMDGANMNAIAGLVNLNELGVDAVHNNLHKTWTIPHGGGGPGDAIVAVSDKLVDFLPGKQIIQLKDGTYDSKKPKHSMVQPQKLGNFGHKVGFHLPLAVRTRRYSQNVVRSCSFSSISLKNSKLATTPCRKMLSIHQNA